MTDNEIIKALEHCRDNGCAGCPLEFLEDDNGCIAEVINLISRQKAEIERLKEDNEALNSAVSSALDIVNSNYQNGRAEAIKEFAERLKEKYPWKGDYLYSTRRTVENIDNLVKEMVGADNG